MKRFSLTIGKFKYLILFAITFTLVLHYSTTVSHACSCAGLHPVQEELERSSAVFTGKAIEIVDPKEKNKIKSSLDPIFILFEVEQSWKGVNRSEIIVNTVRDSASCGYNFNLNQEYLVYAQGDEQLNVTICSRTAPLALAQEDLKELGKGDKPTENVSIDLDVHEQHSSKILMGNLPKYIIILLVGLMAGIITYKVKRR